jgi:hypothetical protein
VNAANAASFVNLPRFKYTADSRVLMTIDIDMESELLLVGQPSDACYEWVIVTHGNIQKYSDCGYGISSIALRDGLIAYHGLPDPPLEGVL